MEPVQFSVASYVSHTFTRSLLCQINNIERTVVVMTFELNFVTPGKGDGEYLNL